MLVLPLINHIFSHFSLCVIVVPCIVINIELDNSLHYVPRVTKNRFLHFGKYTFKQLFSNIHKFLEIKPKELALYYEK